ncbi:hypothetical protein QR680_011624 [Steinernema hermaphroditum]|uniref:Protein-tyrosine-phosphatase n=1 Tax=Steinernema hermaphroditum TaxID=289476 RepID=A0AA39I0X0_9BILA|nr:hypothetical protein QR680_011624 [Steinernema hermaphroditum]
MNPQRVRTNSSSSKKKRKTAKAPGDNTVYTVSVQGTVKIDRQNETFSPEAKEVIKKFVEDVIKTGVHPLRLSYAELRSFVPPDNAKTASVANPTKCRYKDVGCLDKTRVVLNWPPGMKGDFIHANRVEHKFLDNTFLCCQGPMDATIPDFWRMIWQEKVKVIIMLCRCEEQGKPKCAQYWPLNKDESRTYFGLTIRNEKIDASDPSFIETRLLLTFGGAQRHLDHLQWTKWPDKSVPKTPMAPFRLLRYTRQYTKNPSVVHCSAGIGRTGTLVMLEMVFKSLSQAKVPDIAQLTRELRCLRSQSVQTEDQYVYVHYALLQLFVVKQVVLPQDIKPFCREYEAYLKLLNVNDGRQLPLEVTAVPFVGSPTKTLEGNTKEGTIEETSVRRRKGQKVTSRSGSKRSRRHRAAKSPDATADGATRMGTPATSPQPSPVPSATVSKTQFPRSIMGQAPAGDSPAGDGAGIPEHRVASVPAAAPAIPSSVPASTAPVVGSSEASNKPAASVSNPQMPKPASTAIPGPSKIIYAPPKMYTIQNANGKKAIIYQRSAQPFIKAIATPQGQQQPQILVASKNVSNANPNSPAH